MSGRHVIGLVFWALGLFVVGTALALIDMHYSLFYGGALLVWSGWRLMEE